MFCKREINTVNCQKYMCLTLIWRYFYPLTWKLFQFHKTPLTNNLVHEKRHGLYFYHIRKCHKWYHTWTASYPSYWGKVIINCNKYSPMMWRIQWQWLWSTLSFVMEMELELRMLRFSNDIMIQQFNSRLWINFSNSVHWTVRTVGIFRLSLTVRHCVPTD